MTAAIQIAPTPRLAFRLMDAADAPLLFELDQDPDRKGIGVLVKVERILNAAGEVLQQA